MIAPNDNSNNNNNKPDWRAERERSHLDGTVSSATTGSSSVKNEFQMSEIHVPQCTNDEFTVIQMEDELSHAAPPFYKEDPLKLLTAEERRVRHSRRNMWICFSVLALLLVLTGLSIALGIMVWQGRKLVVPINANTGTSSSAQTIQSNTNDNTFSRSEDFEEEPKTNTDTNTGGGGGTVTPPLPPPVTPQTAYSPPVESSQDRESAIYGTLIQVSDPASLQIGQSTPQRQAYEWIVQQDGQQVGGDNPDEFVPRYALAVLYYSLKGANWFSNGRWLSDRNVCEWMGVQCGSTTAPDGTVNIVLKGITLRNLNLSGEVPPEIGFLTYLESLELQQNWFLKGSLPETVGNLRNLQHIIIFSTSLSGSIPDSIGDLLELRTLNLRGNKLFSQIPQTLRNLYQLETLDLSDNKLTGSIPDGDGSLFSGLVSLQTLRLEGNDFMGSVPSAVCGLPYLDDIMADCSLPCQCCSSCL
jgi:hypothetical protein